MGSENNEKQNLELWNHIFSSFHVSVGKIHNGSNKLHIMVTDEGEHFWSISDEEEYMW